jgi:hypothetical protein
MIGCWRRDRTKWDGIEKVVMGWVGLRLWCNGARVGDGDGEVWGEVAM